MFALFGLVVAFTFSGAASRFNEKRILIAEEANAIETAYCGSTCCRRKRGPNFKNCFADTLTLDWRPIGGCQTWRQRKSRWPIQEPPGGNLGKNSRRHAAPEFSSRRRQATAACAKQHDRHYYDPQNGTGNPSPEHHLCTSVHPRSHLLPTGWLSDGKWPAPELAAHLKFRDHHRHHRIRNHRC